MRFFLHFDSLNSIQIHLPSDFEEHLEDGLDKNADNTEIRGVAVYCEEEDLKWNWMTKVAWCPTLQLNTEEDHLKID